MEGLSIRDKVGTHSNFKDRECSDCPEVAVNCQRQRQSQGRSPCTSEDGVKDGAQWFQMENCSVNTAVCSSY